MRPTSSSKGDSQLLDFEDCQQGDVVNFPLLAWLAHGDRPTTEYSKAHAAPGKLSTIKEGTPHGHAIITQTCDLVPRGDRDRPFVALAPLVELPDSQAKNAANRRMPRYAHLPSYSDGCYFADLDRIMTVETGVVLGLSYEAGLASDSERQDFARAVGRKFQRFAFPDDLPTSLSKWKSSVISKHGKEESDEGILYRAAADVRIHASPGWDADEISVRVSVLFPPGFLPAIDPGTECEVSVVADVSALDAPAIAKELNAGVGDAQRGLLLCERIQKLWSDRCQCVGVITNVEFEVLGTDEMTVDV